MSDCSKYFPKLPPEQQAIRDKCFHPTGTFVRFEKEEIEQSIPERFEKIVRKYPDRIAVKTGSERVTYSQLNTMANRIAHAIVARRGTQAEAVAILLRPGPTPHGRHACGLEGGQILRLGGQILSKGKTGDVLEDSQAGLIICERQHGEVGRHFNSTDSNVLDIDSITSRVLKIILV